VPLTLHAKAPVIQIHIGGPGRSESVAWSLLRRRRIRVRYGNPIDLSPG
jgi:hypothetical protein